MTLTLLAAACLPACSRPAKPPPPDARRPVLKTEAELAAERAEQVRSGAVVPTSTPALSLPAPASRPARTMAAPLRPTPGAIEADILIVNDAVLSVAEVLYPLREAIEEARREQTHDGFLERVRLMVREQAQRDIGTLLVYREATAGLDEQQKKMVEQAVKKALDERVAQEFGGVSARLSAHLAEYGLTLDQYKARLEREMVVRQYTRERMLPQISIRRDELLAEYQRNIAKYSTPETRELLLIEVPFGKCLPDGGTWAQAPAAAKAQAKLKAVRRIREAQEALAARPFEEVAREYSLGPQAEQGGAWGPIGRPLQGAYGDLSKLIFEYSAGQASEPIETETGWYIVKCGAVAPAQQRSFLEVQEEIRNELVDRRYLRLSSDYIVRLAERATISSFDTFLTAAVRRADRRVQMVGPK